MSSAIFNPTIGQVIHRKPGPVGTIVSHLKSNSKIERVIWNPKTIRATINVRHRSPDLAFLSVATAIDHGLFVAGIVTVISVSVIAVVVIIWGDV